MKSTKKKNNLVENDSFEDVIDAVDAEFDASFKRKSKNETLPRLTQEQEDQIVRELNSNKHLNLKKPIK